MVAGDGESVDDRLDQHVHRLRRLATVRDGGPWRRVVPAVVGMEREPEAVGVDADAVGRSVHALPTRHASNVDDTTHARRQPPPA
jgi:hypothetical protein